MPGVPCQLIKPACFVLGLERHKALGLLAGVPAPNPNTFWLSLFTIYNSGILGDEKSQTVFSSNLSALIKRGHDSKHMRPHLSVFFVGPPPVPIPVDLGLITVIIAFGSAKTLWGPYSVKADIDGKSNPAVNLMVPVSFIGFGNFVVCSEPTALPNVFNVQVPNSVFAGMTPGDILGNVVSALIDIGLAYALDKFMEWGPVGELVGKASAFLGGKLAGVLALVLPGQAMKFLTRQFLEVEEKEVRNAVTKEVETEVEKAEVMRPLTKLLKTEAGKAVEWVHGKLGSTEAIDKAGEWADEKWSGEHEGGESNAGEGGGTHGEGPAVQGEKAGEGHE